MLEYVLGCLTVGVVWFFWPKITAALRGEAKKISGGVESGIDKIKDRL